MTGINLHDEITKVRAYQGIESETVWLNVWLDNDDLTIFAHGETVEDKFNYLREFAQNIFDAVSIAESKINESIG